MRFLSVLATALTPGKRQQAGTDSLQESEVKDPQVLTRILRKILNRLASVEAVTGPEPAEFEVNVSNAGATVTLQHNFGCPVRYWVTYWCGSITSGGAPGTIPTAAPVLVASTSSDLNTLVLKSYVVGKAVIRVEPSQYSVVTL